MQTPLRFFPLLGLPLTTSLENHGDLLAGTTITRTVGADTASHGLCWRSLHNFQGFFTRFPDSPPPFPLQDWAGQMVAHNSGASYRLLQLSVYVVKVIEKKDAGVVDLCLLHQPARSPDSARPPALRQRQCHCGNSLGASISQART